MTPQMVTATRVLVAIVNTCLRLLIVWRAIDIGYPAAYTWKVSTSVTQKISHPLTPWYSFSDPLFPNTSQ